SLAQDGTEEGTISVSTTTVSYNAFTGSHYAQTSDVIETGMLVSLTGNNGHLGGRPDSEILYGVAKTTKENDSKVLGAYLSVLNPSETANDVNPHLVMAVGNGDVWVVDSGSPVSAGDYLISSDTIGHAMVDPGTAEISYIVARSAEDIDWSTVTDMIDGKKHKKISILFDSFARNNADKGLQGGTVNGNLVVNGKLTITDLEVTGNAIFKGTLYVQGDASFEKLVYYNKNTIGEAVFDKTDIEATITFEQAYGKVPVVSLTAEFPDSIVASTWDGRYWIESKTTNGFKIKLSKPLCQGDIQACTSTLIMNWTAFGQIVESEAAAMARNGGVLPAAADPVESGGSATSSAATTTSSGSASSTDTTTSDSSSSADAATSSDSSTAVDATTDSSTTDTSTTTDTTTDTTTSSDSTTTADATSAETTPADSGTTTDTTTTDAASSTPADTTTAEPPTATEPTAPPVDSGSSPEATPTASEPPPVDSTTPTS
ncbi:MAG: H-type lectin domain-containing protein, partial [bacterium]